MKLPISLFLIVLSNLAFSQVFEPFSLEALSDKNLIFKKDLSLKPIGKQPNLNGSSFSISEIDLSANEIMITSPSITYLDNMPCVKPDDIGTIPCVIPNQNALMPIINPTDNKLALIREVK